jgi:hypothetical protein
MISKAASFHYYNAWFLRQIMKHARSKRFWKNNRKYADGRTLDLLGKDFK